ncbi:MAG: hypothetical protein JRN68_04795 [Nitrososphaerota archaeon]|nr:hypothetical protein [Nitrososphaerota archaeon]
MLLPHEETINIILAEVIGGILGESAQVSPEEFVRKRGSTRRFDLKIYFRGIEFIMEASYDAEDAEMDAKKRLEEGLINSVAVAVHYRKDFFERKRTTNDIKNALLSEPLKLKTYTQGRDISGTLLEFIHRSKHLKPDAHNGWMLIPIHDFGSFIDSVVELIVKEDIVADITNQIEEKVNSFVDSVLLELKWMGNKDSLLEELNKLLFSPSFEKGSEIYAGRMPPDIILAHTYISILMASIQYESVFSKYGLHSLRRHLNAKRGDSLLAFKDAFESILKEDYENIFDVAMGIIDSLSDVSNESALIQLLSDIVSLSAEIVRNKALLRRDFIGQVYHKVTGDVAVRKGYATFYTKAPAAVFLSTLTLGAPNKNWESGWKDIKELSAFKVCDFSCGSGTLLSGVYISLLSKYREWVLNQSGQTSVDMNLEEFHRTLLEESLWGFDALEHAVQTASVVLSLHEPGVALDHFNIYHLPISRSGATGSLVLWETNSPLLPVKRRTARRARVEKITVPQFDVIIGNPPFSRSTAPGREGSVPAIFGFITDEATYQKLWNEYSALIERMSDQLLNRQRNGLSRIFDKWVGQDRMFRPQEVAPISAGASLPFAALGDMYLKEHGRLALVLPKGVLESSAYFLMRALFLARYDIKYIITSEEEENFNFSYSTHRSEVLLVMRKLARGSDQKGLTRLVRFKTQPKTTLEGLLAANMLLKHETTDETSVIRVIGCEAEVTCINRESLEEHVGNWSTLTDTSGSLLNIVDGLSRNLIFGQDGCAFCHFEEIIADETARISNPRNWRGAGLNDRFEQTDDGRFHFLGSGGADVFGSFRISRVALTMLSPLQEQASHDFNEKSGHVGVAENVRYNTMPLLAVYSDTPFISGVTFTVEFQNPDANKGFACWVNSTFGILQFRLLSSAVEGRFAHLRGWHFRQVLLPDLRNKVLSIKLAGVFEIYAGTKWKALPDQFKDAVSGEDDTRLRFDIDVLKALCPTADWTNIESTLKHVYIEMLSLIS